MFFFFRSPSRSPPLGCSLDSMASFEGFANRSFGEKDNKILELSEKNIELERKILDLEENLREKASCKKKKEKLNSFNF